MMSERNQGKRIGVVGTQSSTMNCINGLTRGGYRIDHVITIPEHLSNDVADYQDLASFSRSRGIPCTVLSTYAMQDDQSRADLEHVNLDLVVVVGWQRLIPEWFLAKVPLGCFGMHGSSLPLPKGRGRSPLNWSILQGKDRFYTYLFRYDAGVDSGAYVGRQRFDICPWDTIQSLQNKNTVSQYLLLLRTLPDLLSGNASFEQQKRTISPSYYPKRTFEDGAIDWSQWTARELFGLIRAVTHPYPGAHTESDGERILIWQAAPFDSCIEFPGARPGEIVEVFTDGTFVVQCFVDTLLVLNYEAASWQPKVGQLLTSLPNASWLKLANMKIEEEGPHVGD